MFLHIRQYLLSLHDIFRRMRFITRFALILLVVFGLYSCKGYEKLLKSNDYQKKYEEALRYYGEEDYMRATTLLDQCAYVLRGSSMADTVFFYRAMAYFHQRDYVMASHYFLQFSTTFGNSPYKEEADYMVPYCFYMQSPKPSLDQSTTVQAIQHFQLFELNYPESNKLPFAHKVVAELKDKLVEKSFISAKLYYDMEKYKASIVALNNALIEYPESIYREEIMFMILKSNFLLAENSVTAKQKERYLATVDEYYSFIAEYPESMHIREAQRLYRSASKKLGNEVDGEELEDLEDLSAN